MKTIIVCDFDGTITKKDSLYNFFNSYASKKWLEVEKLWKEGKISSKNCLMEQFGLVNNLDKNLIDNYLKTVEIDDYFKDFLDFINQKKIDFIIVSDGIDYFIKKILNNHGIKNLKIISNKGYFENGKFKISFQNSNNDCSCACCKCKVVNDFKQIYDKIIYIGDGYSDFCVSRKVGYIFAKNDLLKYLEEKEIKCMQYKNFKEVIRRCCV